MTFQKYFKNNSQNMVFFKNNIRTKKIQEQFKEFKELKNEWPPCAIIPTEGEDDDFVSNIFTRKKRDDTYRMMSSWHHADQVRRQPTKDQFRDG